MKVKEINERNEQIAMMLGLKALPKPYLGAFECNENTVKSFKIFFNGLLEDESWYNYPKFDSDWNWLMEALEFISDPDYGIYYKIGPKTCEIADNGKRGNVNLNAFKVLAKGTSTVSTKEAVFIAVSDFAKTFNSK